MNNLTRREFVAGSAALGLVLAARAHAPDEYMLIEPQDPKVSGFDAAVRSYVDFLYQLA